MNLKPLGAHTPGPWFLEPPSAQTPHIWISAPSNSGIAKIEICDYEDDLGERLINEDWANAHLIAAAPDLLAVAIDWLALIDAMKTQGGDVAALPSGVIEEFAAQQAELINFTRDAIAKAEGREHG